jgi:molybdopterin-containing oxidoreductase family iron-sulfur binding subunit
MLCQHCEKAPCEVVCPVEATTHSAEGINEMTYNRCVGTRYCSNNCPYKVRRFNFLQYSDVSPLAELRHNPDVTVRQRGVMEKCTFCVQRLNATRVEIKQLEADAMRATSDEARRQIRTRMDDRMRSLQTACQQACPTEAIAFGDMNWQFADGSRPAVVPEKEQGAAFMVLQEMLQTQPRVTYLPRLPNPGGGAA